MMVRVGKVLSLMLTRRAGKDGKWVDGWLRKREAPDLDSTQQTRPPQSSVSLVRPEKTHEAGYCKYWQCVAHNLQMIMDGQGMDSVRRTVNHHQTGRDEFAPGRFPCGPWPGPFRALVACHLVQAGGLG